MGFNSGFKGLTYEYNEVSVNVSYMFIQTVGCLLISARSVSEMRPAVMALLAWLVLQSLLSVRVASHNGYRAVT